MSRTSVSVVEIAVMLENRVAHLSLRERMVVAQNFLDQFCAALENPNLKPCVLQKFPDGSVQLTQLDLTGPNKL